MTIFLIIIFLIISYLIGSFSSAYWYGKWFFGVDIRKFGSENAGTTNILRTLGAKPAIYVFVTDVLKSFIAVMLIMFVPEIIVDTNMYYVIKISFGIFAVIGHIFPIFSGFKGGKGVASMLGVILAVSPIAALLSLLIFIIVLFFTRIVSISSISAAISFPIIIFIIEANKSIVLTVFSILACLLIIVTHRKNIKRIFKRQEKKISFRKK